MKSLLITNCNIDKLTKLVQLDSVKLIQNSHSKVVVFNSFYQHHKNPDIYYYLQINRNEQPSYLRADCTCTLHVATTTEILALRLTQHTRKAVVAKDNFYTKALFESVGIIQLLLMVSCSYVYIQQ